MERDAINTLVEKENERRRYQIESDATELIRRIGDLQGKKAALDTEIAEARKELLALNTELVEINTVLG